MIRGSQNPNVMGRWGSETEGGTRIVASEKQWVKLLLEHSAVKHAPRRHRILVHACELFEDWQGVLNNYHGKRLWFCRLCGIVKVHDHWMCREHDVKTKHYRMWQYRNRFFRMVDLTPFYDWIIVTKRPENVMEMWTTAADYKPEVDDVPPQYRHNAWLGISFHDQRSFDKRIGQRQSMMRQLRDITPVLFFEAMPLAGPVDIPDWVFEEYLIDWITIGGQSPGMAPADLAWMSDLIDQADAHRIPVFVNSIGNAPKWRGNPYNYRDLDGKRHYPSKGGEDMDQWPLWLRRREIPAPGELCV